MRLCTVRTNDLEPFFGIEIKDKILRIAATAEALRLRPAQRAHLASIKDYLIGLPHSEKLLRRVLQSIAEDPSCIVGKAEDGFPFLIAASDVEWLPPIPNPGKILCVGLNYRDHCEEQNRPVPQVPMLFNKFTTSLLGAGADIPLPLKYDPQIDYEAELALVIGKEAKRVRKGSAMKHVAGYIVANDVSARTVQNNERQWSRAKGFDGSGPMGPTLVTVDEIDDPHMLDIKCRVNGKIMQSSNTKNLVFRIEYLIQFITELITLEPGDIVLTGTPGGVGVFREPPVFLKPGDEVSVEIEKIGVLTNKCVKG